MNKEIADIVLGKISGLEWVDRYAGMVRPYVIHQPGIDGKAIKKTFPVSCNVTDEDCVLNGTYKDLIPDSKYKSLLYFEDLGINIIGSDRSYINCQSNIKLVCWLNGKKLGYDGCGISAVAVMSILKVFAGMFNPFNEGNFVKIKISAISEMVKDNAIFSKYSYDEAQTQYLAMPYDFFALNLKVDFSIPFNCITDFQVLEELC